MDRCVLDVLGDLFGLRTRFEKRAGEESVGSRRQTIGGHVDPLGVFFAAVDEPVFDRVALHGRSPIRQPD